MATLSLSRFRKEKPPLPKEELKQPDKSPIKPLQEQTNSINSKPNSLLQANIQQSFQIQQSAEVKQFQLQSPSVKNSQPQPVMTPLLKEALEKALAMVDQIEERVLKLKGTIDLKSKVQQLISTLRQSQFINPVTMQNPAFANTVKEVNENLALLDYQTTKYQKANAVKKKMISKDVRHKLKALMFNIAFLDRLLDSCFVNQIAIYQKAERKEFIAKDLDLLATTELQQKILEMDRQLEYLRKQQMESAENMAKQKQQVNIESERKHRADQKKKEELARKQAMLNQREEENKQHKQSIQAQNLCYEADYIFFGFKKAEGDTLERAIQLYEESAHLGDSKAMMALGRIYENGLGTKPDFQKAYVYYDLAAAINEPFALYWLGRACEMGFNQEQKEPNLQLAFKFYKKAAELDSKEAIYKLGQFYQNGTEVEKNVQFAIRKYEENVAYSHELSMNALGSLFYNDMKDYTQAAEWFRKAAERGCSRALNNLGICYEFGHGVDQDMDLAFQYYSESAQKGHVQAMFNLGFLYFQKANTTQSHEQFKQAYIKFQLVIQKSPDMVEPYYYIGQLHEHGLGIDKDFSTALRYYRLASNLGYAKGYTKCGDFVYSGKGCGGRRDKSEAFRLYTKAASLGDSEAMNNIGLMSESGFDEKLSDPDQALEYYKKAHKLGNTDATINLALFHLNGVHIEKDMLLGKYLLKQAYKGGNEKAGDYLIQFNIVKNKKELEAELQLVDEEVNSQYALSSAGFNQLAGNISTKKNREDVEQQARNTGGFGSAGGWGKNSVEDFNGGGFRSSLRSLNNNSSKMMAIQPFGYQKEGQGSIQSS